MLYQFFVDVVAVVFIKVKREYVKVILYKIHIQLDSGHLFGPKRLEDVLLLMNNYS